MAMNTDRARVVEDWHKKEFLRAMQHKGKLPKSVTEASEKFDKTYYDTAPRIFPGKGGMDTVLENMIKSTEERINTANKPGLETFGMGTRTQQPELITQAGQATMAVHKGKAAHKELKERLKKLDQELAAERTARHRAEHEMLQLSIKAERAAAERAEGNVAHLKAVLGGKH